MVVAAGVITSTASTAILIAAATTMLHGVMVVLVLRIMCEYLPLTPRLHIM